MPKGVYPTNGLATKGKKRPPFSEEWRMKIALSRIGTKVSAETRAKLSLIRKGRIPWNKGIPMSKERAESFGKYNKGRKFTEEHKEKMSIANRGDKHWAYGKKGSESHFWRGGLTPLRKQIYSCHKYHAWRRSVFKRDNFTCQTCGDNKGGNLEADHIKPFAFILLENKVLSVDDALNCEELWNITNGRTLCKTCHKDTPTYGWKTREWLRDGSRYAHIASA